MVEIFAFFKSLSRSSANMTLALLIGAVCYFTPEPTRASSLHPDLSKVWDGKFASCNSDQDLTHTLDHQPLSPAFYWRPSLKLSRAEGANKRIDALLSVTALGCVKSQDSFFWINLEHHHVQQGRYLMRRPPQSQEILFEYSNLEVLLINEHSQVLHAESLSDLPILIRDLDYSFFSPPPELLLRGQLNLWTTEGVLLHSRPVNWGTFRINL